MDIRTYVNMQMTARHIRKFCSIIAAFALILAVFVLPQTICVPDSEVNTCCASGKCDTAMVSCLCCRPSGRSVATPDDTALLAVGNSLPLRTLVPVLKPQEPPATSILFTKQMGLTDF